MKMLDLINLYLADKTLSWSETTKKSERSRLIAAAPFLTTPEVLWQATQRLKPYSRTTTWTRAATFMDWAIGEGHLPGPNGFAAFRTKNSKQFKNTYQRRIPQLSFEEAVARVNQLAPSIREKALQLLYSGMRWSESFTLQDGWVTGKGGKPRRIPHRPSTAGIAPFAGSYSHFYQELRKVGLKPHDLRKLALKQYVASGANPFELAQVAGWASINTAQSYIDIAGPQLDRLHKEAFK